MIMDCSEHRTFEYLKRDFGNKSVKNHNRRYNYRYTGGRSNKLYI